MLICCQQVPQQTRVNDRVDMTLQILHIEQHTDNIHVIGVGTNVVSESYNNIHTTEMSVYFILITCLPKESKKSV
jgi:homoserine kinase